MTVRNKRDLQGILIIGKIVGKILAELRPHVKSGITTKQLDSICGKLLDKYGASPAPKREYGFPGNLCISVNDEVVHGIPSERIIHSGDIVKLDLLAEKDGYLADSTICVGVGPVSKQLTEMMMCVEKAFYSGIRKARAGTKISKLGGAIERQVQQHGFTVVHELSGHGVGLSCHEPPNVPNYAEPFTNEVLTEGLVIAVEPIITSGTDHIFTASDGWTVRTSDRHPSAHFEHTIMITQNEPIILTAA